jgi:glycosyltransferase involved in cell wall biosynthesis
MPPALPGVSVCFPAYNEQDTIAGVLEEAHALVADAGIDYEILVCDDGSTDRTGAIIDALAARIPRMRVIHHPRNLGIHDTFEHLYRETTKTFVFLNSTDRQWDTRILLDMLPLTRDYDVIIASRIEKYYRVDRRFVSWGFNVVPRLLFGVSTYDAGAVKLVRREIIERFALVSRSPFSEAERLIRAARAGYRVLNRPTRTSPRRSGRARGISRTLVKDALLDVPRVWRALRADSGARVVVDKHPVETTNADRP